MTDEEKKALDLLKNIDKQKCVMLECPVVKNNIERQLKIIELNRIIRKQSKEIEELKEKNRQGKMRIVQLEHEITARIEERNKWLQEYDEQEEMNESQKDDYRLIKVERNILQSLLEKE